MRRYRYSSIALYLLGGFNRKDEARLPVMCGPHLSPTRCCLLACLLSPCCVRDTDISSPTCLGSRVPFFGGRGGGRVVVGWFGGCTYKEPVVVNAPPPPPFFFFLKSVLHIKSRQFFFFFFFFGGGGGGMRVTYKGPAVYVSVLVCQCPCVSVSLCVLCQCPCVSVSLCVLCQCPCVSVSLCVLCQCPCVSVSLCVMSVALCVLCQWPCVCYVSVLDLMVSVSVVTVPEFC